jgi:hypothetical protein
MRMTWMKRAKRMNFMDDGSQMMMSWMMLLSFRTLKPITRTGLVGKRYASTIIMFYLVH